MLVTGDELGANQLISGEGGNRVVAARGYLLGEML
jgi:hypothetical protein